MKTLIKLSVIIIAMILLFIKIYVPLMSEVSDVQAVRAENQNLKENSERLERNVVFK
jgi:sensor domain CHASE-containing protein